MCEPAEPNYSLKRKMRLFNSKKNVKPGNLATFEKIRKILKNVRKILNFVPFFPWL